MPIGQGGSRQGRWRRIRRAAQIAFALLALALPAVPARAADPVADPVIAAAGDIACDPADPEFNEGNGSASKCRQRYTSDLLVNARLSTVLALGDLQYEHGALAKFQASYDPSWGRVKAITHPVIGNHDLGTGYYDYFNGLGAASGPAGPTGRGYYSFNLGAWHLLALNTNCWDVGGCHAGSTQEQWLKDDLARNPSSCTLAYWHESFFSSSRPGAAARAFWDDLYVAGADLILGGHVHNYERFAPQTPDARYDPAHGVRQFVVGTGGYILSRFGNTIAANSELRLDSSFGVLMMTLRPTSYEWRLVSETGAVEDSGSGICHGPPPTPSPARSSIPVSRCTVVGTAADDVLMGTRRRDVICGLDGNDEIRGGAGADVLSGGGGNDSLLGGAGNDRIRGDGGHDRLRGGKGRDRIYGGPGHDRLFGDGGDDRLVDSGGSNWINGNSGNDVIVSSLGRRGRDLVDGGPGRDRASVSRRDRTRRVERFFQLR